jgi:hypothetical protein
MLNNEGFDCQIQYFCCQKNVMDVSSRLAEEVKMVWVSRKNADLERAPKRSVSV